MDKKQIKGLDDLILELENTVKSGPFNSKSFYISELAERLSVDQNDLKNILEQRNDYLISPVFAITHSGITDYVLVIRK